MIPDPCLLPCNPMHVLCLDAAARSEVARDEADGRKHVCPFCGLKVAASEFDAHLASETAAIDSANGITPAAQMELTPSGRPKRKRVASSTTVSSLLLRHGESDAPGAGTASNPRTAAGPAVESAVDRPETSDHRCAKRAASTGPLSHSQQRASTGGSRRRRSDPASAPPLCCICGARIHGGPDAVNAHIDACLARRAATADDSSSFVEYEVAGQRRVRLTALVDAPMSALISNTVGGRRAEDDADPGEQLDIESDGDAGRFGAPQFSEADLLNVAAPADAADATLRARVASATAPARPRPPRRSQHRQPQQSGRAVDPVHAAADEARTPSRSRSPHSAHSDGVQQTNDSGTALAAESDEAVVTGDASGAGAALPADARLLIDALKARIRELTRAADASAASFRCQICLSPYHNPTVSVRCWHVHCDACWLRSLALRRLCPQCLVITAPADLRRIYC